MMKLTFDAMKNCHFILYGRSYCHLCDDMRIALQTLRDELAANFTFAVIDVDADQALVARYDELVPVLLGQYDDAPPQQLCHYFFDAAKVRAFLDGR